MDCFSCLANRKFDKKQVSRLVPLEGETVHVWVDHGVDSGGFSLKWFIIPSGGLSFIHLLHPGQLYKVTKLFFIITHLNTSPIF